MGCSLALLHDDGDNENGSFGADFFVPSGFIALLLLPVNGGWCVQVSVIVMSKLFKIYPHRT